MLPLWYFKDAKMQIWKISTHLGGSFDYDFTQGVHFIYDAKSIIWLIIFNWSMLVLPLIIHKKMDK
jgi:hypothetical protein